MKKRLIIDVDADDFQKLATALFDINADINILTLEPAIAYKAIAAPKKKQINARKTRVYPEDILREFALKQKGPFRRSELVELAKSSGYSWFSFRDIIGRLQKEGKLISPKRSILMAGPAWSENNFLELMKNVS